MTRCLVFDIETSLNPVLVELALAGARSRAEARGQEPPEGELVQAEMSLSPVFGRIVAVGIMDVDTEESLLWAADDERELLRLFWHSVQGVDLFIGYNSMAFDVPFLELRARILGVEIPVEISQRRYYIHNHLDLYEIISAWRGNRSRHLRLDLGTVARALGVEPPMGDGAEVPKLAEAGDFESIRKHLESDLRATLSLWRRLGCPGRC